MVLFVEFTIEVRALYDKSSSLAYSQEAHADARQLRNLTVEEQKVGKKWYPELLHLREHCFDGFLYTFSENYTLDDTREERQKFFEKLWKDGSFRYWLGNYKDYLINKEANQEVYDFWANKQRERINDLKKKDLLAPLRMPHYWVIKRRCLEYAYFEQFNCPNVDVINIKNSPIISFDETGLNLEYGTHYDFDVICTATSFDVVTGGMTSAAYTYPGTNIAGYPNLFHTYEPQAPTLLSNVPTTIQVQGRWITDVIKYIKRNGIKHMNSTEEASKAWKQKIDDLSNATIFPTIKSTHMGGSKLDKAFEQTNCAGGLHNYGEEIRKVLPEFDGFNGVKASA